VIGAPRDDEREAVLEGRGPRRVVAPQGDAEDSDALRVDVVTAGQVLVAGGAVLLGLDDRVQPVQPQRAAGAGLVDEQRRDTAPGQLLGEACAGELLLEAVEAVPHDEAGRRGAVR
jgi:hypothetical protein